MKLKLPKYPKGNRDRKVEVHIDNHDTWNLDHTLALIILPALIQLKTQQHGVPGQFASIAGGASYDAQDSFDFYKETHDEAFQKTCKQWEEILDKMIWSFEQIAFKDWEDRYHHGKAKYERVKEDTPTINPVTGQPEYMYRIVDTNPNEHWYDMDGAELHRNRIQEGLDLFTKYYSDLWD